MLFGLSFVSMAVELEQDALDKHNLAEPTDEASLERYLFDSDDMQCSLKEMVSAELSQLSTSDLVEAVRTEYRKLSFEQILKLMRGETVDISDTTAINRIDTDTDDAQPDSRSGHVEENALLDEVLRQRPSQTALRPPNTHTAKDEDRKQPNVDSPTMAGEDKSLGPEPSCSGASVAPIDAEVKRDMSMDGREGPQRIRLRRQLNRGLERETRTKPIGVTGCGPATNETSLNQGDNNGTSGMNATETPAGLIDDIGTGNEAPTRQGDDNNTSGMPTTEAVEITGHALKAASTSTPPTSQKVSIMATHRGA